MMLMVMVMVMVVKLMVVVVMIGMFFDEMVGSTPAGHWNFLRYITKSILCMPICIRGTIIGVVQMVNKQHGDGVFTKVILMVVVVVIKMGMIIMMAVVITM